MEAISSIRNLSNALCHGSEEHGAKPEKRIRNFDKENSEIY